MKQPAYIGTNPLLWLVVVVMAFVVVGQFRHAKADEAASKQSYVQTMCDAARQSGDFSSCYAAQNSDNVEYLCNRSASCWTEVH